MILKTVKNILSIWVLFEENSITGTIYLNSFDDLNHSSYSTLGGKDEGIVKLTRPIRRYAYVADYKTIKAIKEKIIYYAKTYGIQLDRHLNISNTLLLTILLEIRKSQLKSIVLTVIRERENQENLKEK